MKTSQLTIIHGAASQVICDNDLIQHTGAYRRPTVWKWYYITLHFLDR